MAIRVKRVSTWKKQDVKNEEDPTANVDTSDPIMKPYLMVEAQLISQPSSTAVPQLDEGEQEERTRRGVELENAENQALIDLNNYATFALVPDITFLIDIRPEEALRRMDNNSDRNEGEAIEFQSRVRKTYHELAEKFQDRFVLLDGHNTIDDIQQKL